MLTTACDRAMIASLAQRPNRAGFPMVTSGDQGAAPPFWRAGFPAWTYIGNRGASWQFAAKVVQ
jgi:hypothetical protein